MIRESWCSEKTVGWNDHLPADQHARWIKFLESLFQLEDMFFPRPEEEIDGFPVLIVFSDGAKLAYGTMSKDHCCQSWRRRKRVDSRNQ